MTAFGSQIIENTNSYLLGGMQKKSSRAISRIDSGWILIYGIAVNVCGILIYQNPAKNGGCE